MRSPLGTNTISSNSASMNAPSASMKPPPLKRRRLASMNNGVGAPPPSIPLPQTATILDSTLGGFNAKGPQFKVTGGLNAPGGHGGGIPSCVSCHRSLFSAPIFCARCSSATCAVCSRTCTASAASHPPTPHLSFSPSPSPSPSLSPIPQAPMPRRSVLGARTANTNMDMNNVGSANFMAPMADGDQNTNRHHFPSIVSSQAAGRRRKSFGEEGYGEEGRVPPKRTTTADEEEADLGYGPGCGRVLCRKCCFENVEGNTTTCYDCYGS